MKKIYYEKITLSSGRSKYVPVAEYDSDYLDSFPKGNHLVMCYPGGKSRRFNIDPNYAAMIAAGRVAEDAVSSAIVKAQEMRPDRGQALTEEQHAAWCKFVDVMGDRGRYIQWPSAREAAEAGVKAMMVEAEKLMENPSVKMAYDHFMLVCELAKEHQNN